MPIRKSMGRVRNHCRRWIRGMINPEEEDFWAIAIGGCLKEPE